MAEPTDPPLPPRPTSEVGSEKILKPARALRYLKQFAALSVVGLILFAVISWQVAGMLIARANRIVGPPPDDFPAVEGKIDSESGSKIATWYSSVESSSATIILVHGMHGDRRNMLVRAKRFRESGYSVALIDLQAHGESPGYHITLGHLERHDVRAVVEFCRKQNPNHRIGIDAVSLGAAATLLGSPLNVDAIVIESVYPTITEAVHNRISVRLGSLSNILAPALLCQLEPRLGISTSQLRPIDKIADVNCPILVASGDLDRHTTVEETRRIYETAKSPKQLVIFKGIAHEDLYQGDPKTYEQKILTFFDQYLRPKESIK